MNHLVHFQLCPQVCDYVKENATSPEGVDDDGESMYDEHGHLVEEEVLDEFGHRTKRQATGESKMESPPSS